MFGGILESTGESNGDDYGSGTYVVRRCIFFGYRGQLPNGFHGNQTSTRNLFRKPIPW